MRDGRGMLRHEVGPERVLLELREVVKKGLG